MALCTNIKDCKGCRLWNESRKECNLILASKEFSLSKRIEVELRPSVKMTRDIYEATLVENARLHAENNALQARIEKLEEKRK